MKKTYLLFPFFLFVFSLSSNAQVNYSFTATTATYVPISGGTTPFLINRPYDYGQTSDSYDEGIANNIPIGFTFNYNGKNYTTINICANGFTTLGSPFREDLPLVENFYINTLRLGPLEYVSGVNSSDSVPEPNTKPVLAPLWDDLNLQTNSNLRYITTGSAGSRIFTFEWSNAKWQYDAAGNTLSFELKLYEGTDIIEFCYKDESGIPNNASASIGITASSEIGGGFLSLQNTSTSPTVSTTIEANGLSQKPANNQVYRFTPLPCRLPLNLQYDATNTSVNFSWEAPAGISSFEFVLNTSPDDPTSGTIVTSTSQTVSSLSPGTKYYLHLRSSCSSSSQSVWVKPSITTSKNSSPAPAIVWQKSLGGSSADGFWGLIRQTSDGGYIAAAQSSSNDGDVTGNHGSFDYWITKVNSIGAIQWQKSLGGSGDDTPFSIEQTSEGGYIVAGYSESNDGDVSGNHGNRDCWIVKLSDIGVIQWQKSLGGSYGDRANSIQQTSDGGYIVAGETFSNDGDVSGNHDLNGNTEDQWVIKLSSTGAIQWQKCLGGSADEFAYSIKQTSDGNYVIAGAANSRDGDVTGHFDTGAFDYWIVKLNSTGDILWQKILGGSNTDIATSVQNTSDGGYIVGGYSDSNDGNVSGNHGNADYWIVKLNSIGLSLWERSFGGSGNEYPISIGQTSDGGYIAAGGSGSNDGDVSGNHGSEDAWLLKLDSSGDFQWQKSIGGSNSDAAYFAGETTDGGYIVGGISSSNDGDVTGNHGSSDIWIVKLEPDALLPVTLINFYGEVQAKQNVLHWTTATELNNIGFEVQRSSDGNNFSKIGFTATKANIGNSNGQLTYDYTDNNYSQGANYYRLKQIDNDGKFSYSNIIMLKNNNALTPGISVYPNPSKNILNVKVVLHGDNKITLLVTDLSGKLLMNKVAQGVNGRNLVKIDITALHPGAYFLKVISSDGRENGVKKFMKE